jgi:hypothetical protein
MNLKTFGVTKVSKCHIVSHCVTSIPQLAYLQFFLFFVNFLLLWCHIVSQCDTCHECPICEMCHTCHKYHCHVSLVIHCVIGGLLGTDFNKVRAGWVGKKWFQSLRQLLRSQPKAKRWAADFGNFWKLVESYFGANWTSVEHDFCRTEFGKFPF